MERSKFLIADSITTKVPPFHNGLGNVNKGMFLPRETKMNKMNSKKRVVQA